MGWVPWFPQATQYFAFYLFSLILPVNFLIILDFFNVIYLKLIDLAESLEPFIEMLYGELL